MMNGKDFIQITGRFATVGEAGSRSATSRAYYGAFHAALELFEEFGCAIPSSGKSHNLVPICLGKSNIAEARRAGRELSDLHSKRIRADYRLDDARVGRTETGRRSVEAADDVARLLDVVRKECNVNASLRDEFIDDVRKTIGRIAP